MFIELNLTLVFVPKIQQPFHKWIFDPLSKKEEKEGPAFQVDSRGILTCVAKTDHRMNRGKVSLSGSSRQSGAKIYLPPDFHRQGGGKERAKEHTVVYFNVLDVESALQAFSNCFLEVKKCVVNIKLSNDKAYYGVSNKILLHWDLS